MTGFKQHFSSWPAHQFRSSVAACQNCSSMVFWIVARDPCTYIQRQQSAADMPHRLRAEQGDLHG
jgi:hypothetical protein